MEKIIIIFLPEFIDTLACHRGRTAKFLILPDDADETTSREKYVNLVRVVYVSGYFYIVFCIFTYFKTEVYFSPYFNYLFSQKALLVDKLWG